jgi:hypothetical protein
MTLVGIGKLQRELENVTANVLPKKFRRFRDKLVTDFVRDVTQGTPVDTGRARNGWEVGVARTPKLNRRPRPAKSGGAPVSRARTRIKRAPLFVPIHIANGVPYISVLEFGGFVPKNPDPSKDKRPDREGRVLVRGGFSVQAPSGMTRAAIIRMRRNARAAARAVARSNR